ncbi:xyloglucan-specific endoglucanase [Grosmannia clavigera kw1407]|uniref:Xyloglucan-specific endoglucanase n=1 Tax=Grosmannia clavigera (strain kw1407 / UAMH 11150) TaxID=655863 RepID=F0XCE0_GROCL|nr:xyloglucan-specific endoglucanase [Grosmannia clavigera kw1407]EFX04028.1 xyloglucan-specific endoglucanase [Grosmannia clavigera kw1407]
MVDCQRMDFGSYEAPFPASVTARSLMLIRARQIWELRASHRGSSNAPSIAMIVTLLLSVLNAGLLAIPIGGTAGVLAGIDYHRRVTGQAPLFSNPSGGGGGGFDGGDGGNGTDDNSTYPGWDGDKPNATVVIGGTTMSEYCQQYNEIAINATDGQNYTVNPNQWGWEQAKGGGLCLNVTTFNNDTYPTNTTAPKWSATWQYPVGETSQPVHAYPNIMIRGDVLPAKLGSLTELGIDMHWTYTDNKTITVTNTNSTVTTHTNSTKRAVVSVDFSANVAIDMFFDKNATKSQLTSDADYEVMVWFAQFGKYADPIGYSDGIVASQIVDGVNFTLYNGTNSKDQHVLTWISENETNKFNGSIHPLLTSLPNLGLKYAPASTDYIGYFSFGSEAYYSETTVIFNVLGLEMNVW